MMNWTISKKDIKRVAASFIFLVGFMIISSLVRAMADDDKRNWWKQGNSVSYSKSS